LPSNRLAVFLTLPVLCLTSALAGQEPGAVFVAVCAKCHGDRAEGNPQIMAPSLAGLPGWYGGLQLEKFRRGVRGKHHADLSGAQMQAIASSLTPELVPALAAYLADLKPVPPSAPSRADPVRGAGLYTEICARCHRFNGQGERAFHSAPLTVLSGWYLAGSLRKFREGVRGYHDGDPEGPKMREIANRLGDREIDDLVGYIAALAERYPPGEAGRRRAPQ
jgi:cytochrome c553